MGTSMKLSEDPNSLLSWTDKPLCPSPEDFTDPQRAQSINVLECAQDNYHSGVLEGPDANSAMGRVFLDFGLMLILGTKTVATRIICSCHRNPVSFGSQLFHPNSHACFP